jgi:hypothetical protein
MPLSRHQNQNPTLSQQSPCWVQASTNTLNSIEPRWFQTVTECISQYLTCENQSVVSYKLSAVGKIRRDIQVVFLENFIVQCKRSFDIAVTRNTQKS